MMVCYIAVPARLIGVKPTYSRRGKIWTTVVGGVLGATVCAPAYVLGRIGILMLGSTILPKVPLSARAAATRGADGAQGRRHHRRVHCARHDRGLAGHTRRFAPVRRVPALRATPTASRRTANQRRIARCASTDDDAEAHGPYGCRG